MADNDWSKQIIEDLGIAMKFKGVLLNKNINFGQTKCPRCGVDNALKMRISNHRNKHSRMWCDTEGCKMSKMME